MPRPLQVITFGCRLNSYESEVIRERAGDCPDTIVINTCAVTAEAERQARRAIRRARRENPDARVVVTGCAAQIDPQRWARMAEVSQVVGNAEKLHHDTWQKPTDKRVVAGDIMRERKTSGHTLRGFGDKVRAFVQVQNGCDHRCTFCVIPYGRGNSRSVPPEQVVEEIRGLLAAGYLEVVLTGVDITSWGNDLAQRPRLGHLVRRLLRELPDLERLRIASVDPAELDDELLSALGDEPRLMPHLHLSLQAGDDLILKRMKRRHSRAQALALCERVRRVRPDLVFGADLIAGFPTESDAMFENTLNLVHECGLTFLHVFPYSERSGTPASRMPQVPSGVRKERAALLRAAGNELRRRYFESRVGSQARVLIAADQTGYCEHYAPVFLPGGRRGELARVRIARADDDRLVGARL